MIPLSRSNLQYKPVATEFDPSKSLQELGEGIQNASKIKSEQDRYNQELLLKYGTVAKQAMLGAQAQKLQQDKLDSFNNYLTDLYQKKQGKLSTQDLLNISAQKNAFEGWQNNVLQNQKRAYDEYKMAMEDSKDTYDKDAVSKNYENVMNTGQMPSSGSILEIKPKDWYKYFANQLVDTEVPNREGVKDKFGKLIYDRTPIRKEQDQRNQVAMTMQGQPGFAAGVQNDYNTMLSKAKDAAFNETPDNLKYQRDFNNYQQYVSSLPQDEQKQYSPETLYAMWKYSPYVGANMKLKDDVRIESPNAKRASVNINMGQPTGAYQFGDKVFTNGVSTTQAPVVSKDINVETKEGKTISTNGLKYKVDAAYPDQNKFVSTLYNYKDILKDSQGHPLIYNNNDPETPVKNGLYMVNMGKQGTFIVNSQWLSNQYSKGKGHNFLNASVKLNPAALDELNPNLKTAFNSPNGGTVKINNSDISKIKEKGYISTIKPTIQHSPKSENIPVSLPIYEVIDTPNGPKLQMNSALLGTAKNSMKLTPEQQQTAMNIAWQEYNSKPHPANEAKPVKKSVTSSNNNRPVVPKFGNNK